jgi:hypothetical protein
MTIRALSLAGAVAFSAVAFSVTLSAAAPSPKPSEHFGASGPYSGLKYVGDVGGNPTNPHANTKHKCPTKGCKPHPKATR